VDVLLAGAIWSRESLRAVTSARLKTKAPRTPENLVTGLSSPAFTLLVTFLTDSPRISEASFVNTRSRCVVDMCQSLAHATDISQLMTSDYLIAVFRAWTVRSCGHMS